MKSLISVSILERWVLYKHQFGSALNRNIYYDVAGYLKKKKEKKKKGLCKNSNSIIKITCNYYYYDHWNASIIPVSLSITVLPQAKITEMDIETWRWRRREITWIQIKQSLQVNKVGKTTLNFPLSMTAQLGSCWVLFHRALTSPV